MSTQGDARPSIAAWLDAEAPDRAPTRLIEASRERVRATAQRRAWWPASSGSDMNLIARLGVTAVAVAAISVVGLTILRAPSVGPAGGLGIFTPVAGHILSGLWGVNPTAVDPTDPSRSTQLRLGPAEVLPLGWSSEGTRLLLIREDPADQTFPHARQLFVLRADGSEIQLGGEGTDVDGAAISPDGSRVVFADDGLFVVDSEGGEPVRIAEEGSSPTYSPDGTQIAYIVGNRGPGATSVWVVDADGSDAHAILVDEPALAAGPSELKWSPAGDRLAIGNSVEGQLAIYTFAPDGTNFTKVITGGINLFWSPDGSEIAFLVPFDAPPGAGLPGLAIANADGSNVRQFGVAASGPWHPGAREVDAEQPPSPPASPTASATTGPTADPPSSGSMWPQSSLEQVREAQQLADAGDPDHAWQVDPGLMSEEWWAYIKAGGVDIVERFLREELGWEQFVFNPFLPSEYPTEEGVLRVVYIRCEPGATNSLYRTFPDGHNGSPGAESCAPTLDELRYETVSLDIAQPGQKGADGVWVVTQWTLTAPFAQADPVVSEAQATARLQEFLAARVAGRGAEGFVDLIGFGASGEVPLLYATTTGAAYERFELERSSGPEWPDARTGFEVRLFADGGATVVEQRVTWDGSRLNHRPTEGTENGEPVAAAYDFFDGLVTFSAADPWHVGFERYAMELGDRSSEAIVLVVDPRPVGAGCANSPAPADSNALADSLRASRDLDVTAPVAVTMGGAAALQMDVVLATGAGDCGGWMPVLRLPDDSDRRGANLERGSRMRLYLVDLPEGSAAQIVGIAVVAPEARFESVVDAATPVLESIAFPAGSGDR